MTNDSRPARQLSAYERRSIAYRLHRAGLNYQRIGHVLHVSRQRARVLALDFLKSQGEWTLSS